METFLQPVILLLLLLLVIDKFYNRTEKKDRSEKTTAPRKDARIMGESKVVLNTVNTVQPSGHSIEKDDTETISPEVLDKIFNSSDTIASEEWEPAEEEEELRAGASVEEDRDFATGLSFEELQRIPNLLEQKKLTPETLPLAVKVADTELLELLNAQIPEAQQYVSELLNRHLATLSSGKNHDSWRDFDIREFV